jgi:hypothetical protein
MEDIEDPNTVQSNDIVLVEESVPKPRSTRRTKKYYHHHHHLKSLRLKLIWFKKSQM